jgi:hypothetical protein
MEAPLVKPSIPLLHPKSAPVIEYEFAAEPHKNLAKTSPITAATRL